MAATNEQYLENLLAANNALRKLTDTLKLPGSVSAQAEDMRAEILAEIETLEEEGIVHV